MNKTMKKILYINNSTFIGGAENSLLLLIEYFSQNFNIHVVVPEPGDFSNEIEKYRVSIHYLKLKSTTKRILHIYYSLVYAVSLIKLILKLRINIIHANSIRSSLDSIIAAKILNVPIIGHIRDIRSVSKIGRILLNQLTSIVTVSEATKKAYIKQGVKKSKVITVYNGVDLDKFRINRSKIDFRFENGIKYDSCVIGIIGQICERKGIKYFLEAGGEIASKHPNINLLVVGDDHVNQGAYLNQMKEYAKSLKIEDLTIFTGFINNIPDALSCIDILVVPSIQEPFGRVVVEGMAMQKPIIASAVDGIPEIIIDKKTGFLVPAERSDKLVEKIKLLLEDKMLRKKFGREGRSRVVAEFSKDVYIHAVEQIYNDYLGEED